MRPIYQVRFLNPPAPLLQVFNFSLRGNDGRPIYQVRFLNPPAPLLQATTFVLWPLNYSDATSIAHP